MSETERSHDELSGSDAATEGAPGAYVPPAPYVASAPYTAQNPYVAASPPAATPYATPYAPAAYAPYAAAPYTPAPYAPAPDSASSAYQPTPTMPAPAPVVPYTIAGQAYVYGPRNNPLAIASLVVSIGAVVVGPIASIVGVVLGHLALRQIARGVGVGRGMAMGGLITGYVLGGLGLAFWLLYFGLIGALIFGTGF